MSILARPGFGRRSTLYATALCLAWAGFSYLPDYSKQHDLPTRAKNMVCRVKHFDPYYLVKTFGVRVWDCVEYPNCTPEGDNPAPPTKLSWYEVLFEALLYTADQLWQAGWQVIVPGLSSLLLAAFGLLWLLFPRVDRKAGDDKTAVQARNPAEKKGKSSWWRRFVLSTKEFLFYGVVCTRPGLCFFVCAVFLLGALLQFAFKWVLVGVLCLFGPAMTILVYCGYGLTAFEMYLRFRHSMHAVEFLERYRRTEQQRNAE